MKKLNWNSFAVKFDGQEQLAFQRLSYALFCNRFNLTNGIFSHKKQIGIEAEPIEDNSEWVGFQAKYLEPSSQFKSKKTKIIEALVNAKDKNSKLNVIYFYINKEFSESNKKGVKHPDYIVEIESKAKELNLSIVWQVPSHFEKQLSLQNNIKVLKEFFPELIERNSTDSKNEKLIEISRTALIQLEIAKIKFEFTYDWTSAEELLNKFYIYSDFRNEIIARDILSFLNINVSSAARSNMPSSIACIIEGLVFSYFPSSYDDKDKEMRIENGKECIYIGFNLVYDSLIYTNNFAVAQWGLSILKFIYRESKRSNIPELVDSVLQQYKELEQTLKRPERDDLENAKALVRAYKNDLDSSQLHIPFLPENLYELISKSN